MKRVRFLLLMSLFLLTGCGGNASETSTSETQAATQANTQAPTQAAAQEQTQTPAIPGSDTSILFTDMKLSEDSLKDPYGVAINSLGHIYVSDMGNDRVLVMDSNGTLLDKWDDQGDGEGEFKTMGFGGLAIDSNDYVFVVDNENYRIQKFDKDGNFITQ